MRLTINAIAICTLSTFLLGCGNDLDCASGSARDLIARIAKENPMMASLVFINAGKIVGDGRTDAQILSDVKAKMTYTVDMIRMTAKDQTTGAVACAANLRGEASGYGAWTKAITYKLEKTSDGQLYGTVYGL
jgi:hypothetical protein